MKYKWFTAAFLSLCLIPAAGMLVLPEQQAAGNEHLTPKPSLWNAQTGWNAEFLGDLTDYVADHFGFRQELVTANAALQTRLLCTSPAEDVIYGTDGWLYYAKTLDDYQNHATLTESEAQQLAQTVKSMQDYCESRGARFLFTIAPNKSSLYPEHMPARYLTEDADGNYERVLPYLEREGVNYADLFSVFRAHANVLYYKTDSHWTNRGAALAHDYLMNTLGLPHTGFTDEEYTTERSHSGDLYQMLQSDLVFESSARKRRKRRCRVSDPAIRFRYVRRSSPGRPRRARTRIKSNRNPSGDQQENAPNGRLLLCRDSFGNALHPFLAEDFREAIITRQMPYPLEQVQEGDTVIIEIVERNLPNILKYSPDLGNKTEP